MSLSLHCSKINIETKAKWLLEYGSYRAFLEQYIFDNEEFHYEVDEFQVELENMAFEEAQDKIDPSDVRESWDDDDLKYEFISEDLDIDDCKYEDWDEAAEEFREDFAMQKAVNLIKHYFNSDDPDLIYEMNEYLLKDE